MAYTFEKKKMKIPRKYDRRIKLTEEDRSNIRKLYFEEGYAIRAVARIYKDKCCRRNIQFILFPERLEKANQNRDWKRYYTKEKGKEYMKKYREYKKTLYDKELLRGKLG